VRWVAPRLQTILDTQCCAGVNAMALGWLFFCAPGLAIRFSQRSHFFSNFDL
jgi:hypothetical protein